MTNRRDLLAGLGLAGLLPGLAGLLPGLHGGVAFAQSAQADLTRVSNYLNGIGTMRGRFVQIGPDGDLSEGAFFMRRPGRIRFEYDVPNPTLIVADGLFVGVIDTVDKTVDRFPLSETPLDLLLRDRVNLRTEDAVRGIDRGAGQLRIIAVDPDAPEQGSITLIFNNNPLELVQWVITDEQGLSTTVALSETQRNVQIGGSLFVIEDP